MTYHITIDKLTIWPERHYPEQETPLRVLHGSIDGVPISVNLPDDIPTTKPAIRDYLIAIWPEIEAAHLAHLPDYPSHNRDIAMEFDWPP